MFNRNFLSILITNVVLGMPMPMLILLGALAGTALAADPALGTLTLSLQMVAGIATAGPLSRYMARVGRQRGFLLVAFVMIIGGAMAAVAMMLQSFWLLCVAHFLMGASLIGVNFLRFAASEAVTERYKANAIAYTLASGLIAALFGPTVFELTRDALPLAYSGAYASIAVLGALGVLPILAFKFPEQAREQTAHAVASASSNTGTANDINAPSISQATTKPATTLSLFETLSTKPGIAIAMLSAIVAQAIMIMLMVPTSLAMLGEGFFEAQAADVIRWHVIAMFAPGLITGTLIKRFGSIRVILAGLAMLCLAVGVGISSLSLPAFYLSLIFLGLGWNFGFIGGTQLLQSELTLDEKGRFQGINDTLIALSSAVASLVSGMLFQAYGWTMTLFVAIPILAFSLLILGMQIHRYRAGTPALS